MSIQTTYHVSGTIELEGFEIEYTAQVNDDNDWAEVECPADCSGDVWDCIWEQAEDLAITDANRQVLERLERELTR